ncbi:MAG: N-formylglutamate amidohydrolase [Pseudomonadota bacterium]
MRDALETVWIRMLIVDDFSTSPAFEQIGPRDGGRPILFNSPHSGRCYPRSFLDSSRLDAIQIRRSEDTFVDELFRPAIDHGAAFMHAFFPRAFLDVNREPYELDPSMFSGSLPTYANVRSIRVAGGLGTIARIVSESEEIYAQSLSVEDAIDRIETIYKPYHTALRDMLGAIRSQSGIAILIDCHSMPSLGRTPMGRGRPDFILGDRYGSSCASDITSTVAGKLKSMGYTVGRNKPYAGGFITEHYGRPADRLHALQIEVNRGLYMNEADYSRSVDFVRLAEDINSLIGHLCDYAQTCLGVPPIAAE